LILLALFCVIYFSNRTKKESTNKEANIKNDSLRYPIRKKKTEAEKKTLCFDILENSNDKLDSEIPNSINNPFSPFPSANGELIKKGEIKLDNFLTRSRNSKALTLEMVPSSKNELNTEILNQTRKPFIKLKETTL
jgi:hypothetical protein